MIDHQVSRCTVAYVIASFLIYASPAFTEGQTISSVSSGALVGLYCHALHVRFRLHVLVVEPSSCFQPAWLLIAQSFIFLTVTFAIASHVVVIKALRVFQQFTPFFLDFLQTQKKQAANLN